jgi:hypothetical protein
MLALSSASSISFTAALQHLHVPPTVQDVNGLSWPWCNGIVSKLIIMLLPHVHFRVLPFHFLQEHLIKLPSIVSPPRTSHQTAFRCLSCLEIH